MFSPVYLQTVNSLCVCKEARRRSDEQTSGRSHLHPLYELLLIQSSCQVPLIAQNQNLETNRTRAAVSHRVPMKTKHTDWSGTTPVLNNRNRHERSFSSQLFPVFRQLTQTSWVIKSSVQMCPVWSSQTTFTQFQTAALQHIQEVLWDSTHQ